MRKPPFSVTAWKHPATYFQRGVDAQEYAQFISERYNCWAEVHLDRGPRYDGNGIVGQYRAGNATPEFAGRGDAWLSVTKLNARHELPQAST